MNPKYRRIQTLCLGESQETKAINTATTITIFSIFDVFRSANRFKWFKKIKNDFSTTFTTLELNSTSVQLINKWWNYYYARNKKERPTIQTNNLSYSYFRKLWNSELFNNKNYYEFEEWKFNEFDDSTFQFATTGWRADMYLEGNKKMCLSPCLTSYKFIIFLSLCLGCISVLNL